MQGTSNRAREFSALGRGAKMALLLSGCAVIAFPAVALAQNTTVAAGAPRTTNLNMDADDTLTVDPGASFSVNGPQAVNINAVTSGAGVVITNSGLIEATTNPNARAINSNGDFAARNVTITNNASGTIRSTIRNAIRFGTTVPAGFDAPGSVIRIDNSGRIETTGTSNAAIEIGTIGGAQFILANNVGATIAAAGLQAIISGTASTITNNGTITGVGNSAIVLNGASTITNNGTITGFGTGAIVLSSNAGNTVTLGASSLTQNGNAPGATPAPATPNSNANAVNFTGDGANTLNLHAGATVIGRLNGSTTGGNDRLNLLAGTGPATLGVVSNFDDIHVQSCDWTQNATINSESGAPLTSVTIDSGATLRWVDSPSGVGGGFLRGAITNNGTFVVGRTGFTSQSSTYDPGDGTTVTVHSVLSGSGDLRIQNGGTFVLTAPNSYTGTTFIENGGLRGDAANVFAPGSAVDIAATGTLNANGFDQTVAGFAGSGRVLLGTAGNSTLTAGGNNASTGFSGTIEQAGNLTKAGSGTLTLSGANSYTGNTAISGGTLAIAGAGSIAASASLALANAGTSFDITGASGAQSVQNLSGAAGSNVQLGAVDLTATYSADAVFAGNIAGSGKFTKAGTGTLTLSGANALTGPFELGLGRLLLTGSVAGDVSALGGTILDGAGAIGGTLTLADNATLNIGNGGVGTLTVGGLILGSTSVLNYDLGAPGVGGASDRIQVNGNLTLDGRLNASDAGGFGAGVYRLIDVTGSVTDNGLSVTGLPAGYFLSQGTVQIAPNQVNLVISATASGIQFWDGAGTVDDGVIAGSSGSWTNAATNWTSLDGTTNAAWEGAFGVFQGAAGTVSVDDAIVFDGLQFMTDGYVIAAGTGSLSTDTAETSLRTDPGVTATIAASIGGTGGLSKRDGGTLILSGANTYGGATLVEGGILQVQGGAAITDGSAVTLASGSTLALVDAETVGSLAGAGNVTLGATLSAGGNGGSTSYSGAMTGAGGFTKTGAGTMTLAGASSFDGLATVGQGTLVLGVANALRSGADVQVDAAATLALGANSVLGTLTGSGAVAGGASRLQIDDGSFAGVISGTGNIVKSSAGTLTLAGANAYTGTTNITGGTLALTGAGSVDATSGFNMSGENSLFDISGANGARTITRLQSAVTTSQIRLGANQLTIVNDGGSLNYLGTITGTGGIRKTGTGQISFNNSNNYGGGTIVEGGTLRAQAVDAFGAGSLDVRGGATVNLAGFGTHASGLLGAGTVSLGAASGGLTLTGGGDFAFTGAISGGAGLAKGGSGTQTLGGANSYTGVTTIGGGTLALSGDGAIAGSSAVALTGAGATLDISGASGARSVNNLTGVTGTAVALGANGLTATYAANGEFAGAIGGSGSFTKAGAGTLTLSGSNGLTGVTNVTAGTLVLTGSVGGDATLSGGATLAGTGSIAGTLTAGSGIVEAGGNAVGTLTVGGLVLGADTVLNYDLGAPGNLAASDRIQVGGNLTLDGTVNGRNAGGFGTGVYRLFDYGGSLTDNGLSVGALPAGFSPAQAQVQTAIGGQVNLIIAEQIPDIQFWERRLDERGGQLDRHDRRHQQCLGRQFRGLRGRGRDGHRRRHHGAARHAVHDRRLCHRERLGRARHRRCGDEPARRPRRHRDDRRNDPRHRWHRQE
jgi:fibronectin-binding autotransporter adhesin